MTTEKKCMIAEQVGEVFIGAAIGTVVANNVIPKCDTAVQKIAVTVGSAIGGWIAGRVWAKHWFKFCDSTFGTDFKDTTEQL